MYGEANICGVKGAYESVLEFLDGVLHGFKAVIVWPHKLEGHILQLEVSFNDLHCLVIYNIDLWYVALFGGKEATAVKVLALGDKLPLALHSSKQSKEDSRPKGVSTPNRPALKAPCPKGSLPMAHDEASLELEDMELHTGEEESKAKSNPMSDNKMGSGEKGEEDDTSIGCAIVSMTKELFRAGGTSTTDGN